MRNETIAHPTEVIWPTDVARDVVTFFHGGVDEIVDCALESEDAS